MDCLGEWKQSMKNVSKNITASQWQSSCYPSQGAPLLFKAKSEFQISNVFFLCTIDASLQPFLAMIDKVDASVSSLEQAAYKLDAYSKELGMVIQYFYFWKKYLYKLPVKLVVKEERWADNQLTLSHALLEEKNHWVLDGVK